MSGCAGKTSAAFRRARRIVVRATNWVGDVLISTPALARLRRLKPDARITVLARASVAPLLENNPRIDDLWVIDDLTTAGWLATARRIRAARFDWGLALPNSTRSSLLMRVGGVKALRGYARDARAWTLSEPVALRTCDLSRHEVLYYLRLLDGLGAESEPPPPRDAETGNPPLEYYVRAAERVELDRLLAELGLAANSPVLAVAPGAAYGTAKRWFPERYAEAAARLSSEFGLTTLILGGPNERATADEVLAHFKAAVGRPKSEEAGEDARAPSQSAINPQSPISNLQSAHSVAGLWTLRAAGALLERARLLLTNDSGLMHLGAALGTPTVAVFGSTDWVTTAPWNARARIVRAETACAPCILRDCPIDHRCMTAVTVDAVVEAAREALARSAAATSPC